MLKKAMVEEIVPQIFIKDVHTGVFKNCTKIVIEGNLEKFS